MTLNMGRELSFGFAFTFFGLVELTDLVLLDPEDEEMGVFVMSVSKRPS